MLEIRSILKDSETAPTLKECKEKEVLTAALESKSLTLDMAELYDIGKAKIQEEENQHNLIK